MPIISAKTFGFSLAEVLLGVALAAIVVLTLVALGLTALKGNRKAADLTLAQSLAHQAIEQHLYQAHQDSSAALWVANDDNQALSQSDLPVGTQVFSSALYVSDASTAATPNLKRCRLRISWWGGTERQGYGRLSTEVIRFASRP